MSLSLNKPKPDNLADDIWKSAEWLRGTFKAYEYYKSLIHECVTGQPQITEAGLAVTKLTEAGAPRKHQI